MKSITTNDSRTYGTSIILCNCTNSKYLNHHHGYIITGDLWIIRNKRFHKIIIKDPNYIEPKIINWKKVKKTSWKA